MVLTAVGFLLLFLFVGALCLFCWLSCACLGAARPPQPPAQDNSLEHAADDITPAVGAGSR